MTVLYIKDITILFQKMIWKILAALFYIALLICAFLLGIVVDSEMQTCSCSVCEECPKAVDCVNETIVKVRELSQMRTALSTDWVIK